MAQVKALLKAGDRVSAVTNASQEDRSQWRWAEGVVREVHGTAYYGPGTDGSSSLFPKR